MERRSGHDPECFKIYVLVFDSLAISLPKCFMQDGRGFMSNYCVSTKHEEDAY